MTARRRPCVLVFQHMSLAHAGIFRDCLQADRIEWDVVALEAGEPIPALEDYDALLVMGGAQDVWQEAEHPWLTAEKRAIRAAVLEHEVPYLGICLGHQLLASALGGEVRDRLARLERHHVQGDSVRPQAVAKDAGMREAHVLEDEHAGAASGHHA